jgi:hypothetical protein
MYREVMGDSFDRLEEPLRKFHSCVGRHEFQGIVKVAAPSSPLAKLLAILLGAPLATTQGPICFELVAEPGCEAWTRRFPGRTMRSIFSKSGHRVIEQLGASRLVFALLELDGTLEMRLEKLYFLGVRCPAWLMPRVTAREIGEGRKLHFEVMAIVPFVGMVTGYTGHLCIGSEGIDDCCI